MSQIVDCGEIEVSIEDRYKLNRSNDPKPDMTVHQKYDPDFRARLAVNLCEKWGMVAAKPADGFDDAGRQQIQILTPEEVVDRACTTADLMVTALHKRGWMTKLPSHDEMVEMLKDEENNR